MGWQVPVLTVVGAFSIALLGQQGTVTLQCGDAEPNPKTRGCQGPASPRKGQSQRLFVKRAWNGFYPHAKGELGSAEAVGLGGVMAVGDMARGDMEPCFALCWPLLGSLAPTR